MMLQGIVERTHIKVILTPVDTTAPHLKDLYLTEAGQLVQREGDEFYIYTDTGKWHMRVTLLPEKMRGPRTPEFKELPPKPPDKFETALL